MKDIKHIGRDFHLVAWVLPQGWDLGVAWGVEVNFFLSKFKQIWCVGYLHEWHMQRHHYLAPPGALGRGQISLNLNYKVIFKDFKPNFVYLLTNDRYITYQTGFSFGRLGHAQGWDFGIPLGVGVIFSEI